MALRVKGVVLTVPVCDWRPVLAPESRLPTFKAGLTRPAFLRGFGQATERLKLRIPWRDSDTLFIDCSRAISLPEKMPVDNVNAATFLRRLYLDELGLVRFELGLFLRHKDQSGPLAKNLADYVRRFWSSSVELKTDTKRYRTSLADALDTLLVRFSRSTTGHKTAVRNDLVHLLNPQIQLMIEAGENETLPGDPLDDRITATLDFFRCDALGRTIDTTTLWYRADSPFTWIRLLRADLAWLHAEVEALDDICGRWRTRFHSPDWASRLVVGINRVRRGASPAFGALKVLLDNGQCPYGSRFERAKGFLRSEMPVLANLLDQDETSTPGRPAGSGTWPVAEQLASALTGQNQYVVSKMTELRRSLPHLSGDFLLATCRQLVNLEAEYWRIHARTHEHQLILSGGGGVEVGTSWHGGRRTIDQLAKKFHTHFTGPTTDSIESFVGQFESSNERRLVLQLLDRIDFYDDERMRKIFRGFVLGTDPVKRGRMVFVPFGGVTDSSGALLYKCSKAFNEAERSQLVFDHLPNIVAKYTPGDVIVTFVDDNCGSGKQGREIFKELFAAPNSAYNHVRPLTDQERDWLRASECIYFVFVGFQEGMRELEEAAKTERVDLTLVAATVDLERRGCFGAAGTVFESDEDTRAAEVMARRIGRELFQTKNWPDDLKHERLLGYGNSQKLLVFAHNTPPCTLPILWEPEGYYKGRQWIPLFPRLK